MSGHSWLCFFLCSSQRLHRRCPVPSKTAPSAFASLEHPLLRDPPHSRQSFFHALEPQPPGILPPVVSPTQHRCGGRPVSPPPLMSPATQVSGSPFPYPQAVSSPFPYLLTQHQGHGRKATRQKGHMVRKSQPEIEKETLFQLGSHVDNASTRQPRNRRLS